MILHMTQNFTQPAVVMVVTNMRCATTVVTTSGRSGLTSIQHSVGSPRHLHTLQDASIAHFALFALLHLFALLLMGQIARYDMRRVSKRREMR